MQERHIGEGSLLYFGESLGSAVVSELATEHPPAGLVLRSPFTDPASMGREHYPFVPAMSLRERYPVVEHVAAIDVPTVVVFGSEESMVPPARFVTSTRADTVSVISYETLAKVEEIKVGDAPKYLVGADVPENVLLGEG